MDTGEGKFKQFDASDELEKMREVARLREKYPNSKSIFTVGEELEIKDSKFKVTKIDQFGIRLRLLK